MQACVGGMEGARCALRHHFLVEDPNSLCPADGQEMTLVLKGLNRRFKTTVNKKSALINREFYKILVLATEEDEHGVVKLCRLRLAAQVALMFLSFARYEESAEAGIQGGGLLGDPIQEGENLSVWRSQNVRDHRQEGGRGESCRVHMWINGQAEDGEGKFEGFLVPCSEIFKEG